MSPEQPVAFTVTQRQRLRELGGTETDATFTDAALLSVTPVRLPR